MKRYATKPRQHWQTSLERLGFGYHSIDGDYWQENAYYEFSEHQIEQIEQATETLHAMCLQAAAHIIKHGDYARLGINDTQARLIEQSFTTQQPCLYGRFDLCYDGKNPPKLLEYNADTPTTLFETSVVQWHWLKERSALRGADQFNSIHERLMVAWKHLAQEQGWRHIHFSADGSHIEDFTTCLYLQDTAIQAGLETSFIDLQDIGHDGVGFVDMYGAPIQVMFKLYPWEWLSDDGFACHLPTATTQWLEPAWKLLLSNKAILCVLWELFTGHPYLLPCYFDDKKLAGRFAKKPFFSREGLNITLVDGESRQSTTGDYGAEGYVYQALHPLPAFTNNHGNRVHALIGSWVVEHSACGMSVREDGSLITQDTSLFVPHIFY